MSFAVFADGSANLPQSLLEGISLLPCEYTVDGEPRVYLGDVDHFDGHAYYEGLRNGRKIGTSLLNTQLFITHFTPVLESGQDIIYVSMSSGISGTYNAAVAAAVELMEEFPDRFVHIVDSKGCGFGNALLALKAAELSRKGVEVREAAQIVDDAVQHACQYFTVDDLNFLKRTGRVSGFTAAIGTVLNIKPILYVVEKYKEKKLDTPEQQIFISHGDCLDDANMLAELVKKVTPGIPVTICQHEPFSGAHVGPGMLALFFWGVER